MIETNDEIPLPTLVLYPFLSTTWLLTLLVLSTLPRLVSMSPPLPPRTWLLLSYPFQISTTIGTPTLFMQAHRLLLFVAVLHFLLPRSLATIRLFLVVPLLLRLGWQAPWYLSIWFSNLLSFWLSTC